MAAPSGTGAAGGGAAQRSSWPGAQTAGAASTGATRAASAWHANVAFAPRRTRQHAWNLHQHCTLAQVPLIDLKSILLKNFAKRIYFKITNVHRFDRYKSDFMVLSRCSLFLLNKIVRPSALRNSAWCASKMAVSVDTAAQGLVPRQHINHQSTADMGRPPGGTPAQFFCAVTLRVLCVCLCCACVMCVSMQNFFLR